MTPCDVRGCTAPGEHRWRDPRYRAPEIRRLCLAHLLAVGGRPREEPVTAPMPVRVERPAPTTTGAWDRWVELQLAAEPSLTNEAIQERCRELFGRGVPSAGVRLTYARREVGIVARGQGGSRAGAIVLDCYARACRSLGVEMAPVPEGWEVR